jgi:hypothetical protein
MAMPKKECSSEKIIRSAEANIRANNFSFPQKQSENDLQCSRESHR